MGKDNKQPNRFRHSKGLQNTFICASKAISITEIKLSFKERGRTGSSGSSGDTEKRRNCYHGSHRLASPEFTVSCKKEGNRPIVNFKKLNKSVTYQNFKMLKEMLQTGGRLQNRSERRLLFNSFVQMVSWVCQISVEGSALRVLLPFFQAFLSSACFLKMTINPNLSVQKTQCQNHHISRQYASDSSNY